MFEAAVLAELLAVIADEDYESVLQSARAREGVETASELGVGLQDRAVVAVREGCDGAWRRVAKRDEGLKLPYGLPRGHRAAPGSTPEAVERRRREVGPVRLHGVDVEKEPLFGGARSEDRLGARKKTWRLLSEQVEAAKAPCEARLLRDQRVRDQRLGTVPGGCHGLGQIANGC